MRAEKTQLLKDIGQMVGDSDYLFMFTYKGLKVKQISELRKSLSKHNATCKVLKNRLVKKAAESIGIKKISELSLTGDTAFIFGRGDAGPVAKVLLTFSKTHEALSAKNAYIGGELLGAKDVKLISELPSLEVLRAQLLGLLLAPSRNLVTILNVKASEIVNVINSYKDKLEKENK